MHAARYFKRVAMLKFGAEYVMSPMVQSAQCNANLDKCQSAIRGSSTAEKHRENISKKEIQRERDIKGRVFSIQEGERGFRSDKLLCKQPPQILPAGGSPSARCFVYQSAPIVVRGHWSSAPCHFPPSLLM